MKSQDAARFAQALAAMGEMYDKPVSNTFAKLYFEDLAEYEADDVLRAMSLHRRDPDRGRFFPKVADLIDKLQPDTEQSAMIAWAEVPKLLRNSRSAKSGNAITERVVQDLGGWSALGLKTASELVWVAKEFIQRYEMYAQHGTDVAALSGPRSGLRLIGRDE